MPVFWAGGGGGGGGGGGWGGGLRYDFGFYPSQNMEDIKKHLSFRHWQEHNKKMSKESNIKVRG